MSSTSLGTPIITSSPSAPGARVSSKPPGRSNRTTIQTSKSSPTQTAGPLDLPPGSLFHSAATLTSPLESNYSASSTPPLVSAHTTNTITTTTPTASPSKASKTFETLLGIGLGVAIFIAISICILLLLRRHCHRRRKSAFKSNNSASRSVRLQRRVSLSPLGGSASDSESEKDPWTTTPRDVISVVSSLSSEDDNAGSSGDEHEDNTGRPRSDSNVSEISGIVLDDGGGAGGNLGNIRGRI